MYVQIEFVTPYYYSTLGYDEELIDYISFVNDDFMHDLLPDYQNHKLGRTPNNPVTMWRMHYLYFTKPEFVTFRQMCRELQKPKQQDYRNFIGVHDIKEVPSHAALSRFRSALGITDQQVEQIKNGTNKITDFITLIDKANGEILTQCNEKEGFLNMELASVDSRPIKSKVGGFKKECTCSTPDKCECPVRFSDKDASVGRQRTKVNQNKYFVGYRKNTVIVRSSLGPVPITSVVVDAKTSDQNVMLPMIEQVEKMGFSIPNYAADMGYMNGDTKIEAAQNHNAIIHTEVKKNMHPPEHCDETGKLECPNGNTMNVLEYCSDSLEIIAGVSDKDVCKNCFKYGVCDMEFVLSMKENPHYYNVIPQGSRLQAQLINFRKQSELNFAIEANLLASTFKNSKSPVKTLKKIDVFMRIADISILTKKMIQHCRNLYRSNDYIKNLRRLAEKSIYSREYSLSCNNVA